MVCGNGVWVVNKLKFRMVVGFRRDSKMDDDGSI